MYVKNLVILLIILLFTQTGITQTWKWIAYGDTRNNPPKVNHKKVLESLIANSPEYKFIINVGDLVDNGDVLSQWEGFIQETSDILDGLGQDQAPPKYMATPGNHDATETILGLQYWNTYLPGQLQQFGNEGKYFTFDYENARFVIMDSDKSPETGAQLIMMMGAIENNPKTWLFAIWHHPIFDFGEKSYEDDFHDLWGVPLYQNGCDIIFNGHAHYYVRSKKLELNGEKNPPLDPENGTVQVVTGNGGAPMDIPDPTHDGNAYLVEAYSTTDSQYGYTEMTVGPDTLWLKHYLSDGSLLDEEVYTPNSKTETSIKEEFGDVEIPTNYFLEQNYPNPFNPKTIIKFGLPYSEIVNLSVFNEQGRLVKTLINSRLSPGIHTVQWDGFNMHNEKLASSMYFYTLKAGSYQETRKLIIIR